VKYRPGYPSDLLDLLRSGCGLRAEHVIADVGSGTGLLSELFLKNGNRVFGVEPNDSMREAGEEFLAGYPAFTSIKGTAEATALADASVDFISVGQAFHWFDAGATRNDFLRILRPAGWVVILWNDRRISESQFGRDYEDLLVRFGTDYTRVKDAYPVTEDMRRFFGGGNFSVHELANSQEFDFEGLCGRLRSSSYAPREDQANFAPMLNALRELFDGNQKDGRVSMRYTTQIYFDRLDALRTSR